MIIDLLNTSSNTRATKKAVEHIAQVVELTVDIKPSATPIFTILRGDYGIDEVNYLYVHEWRRYYFIDCIIITSDSTLELRCHMDMFAE